MSCTSILVGKKASNDGSTMVARTDDGRFDVKKTIVVKPEDQPKKYVSKISHVEIDLPEEPMRYTASPSVDDKEGIWAATGINAANVGMTATETISSNPRVLAADPLVVYVKAKTEEEKDIPGGIGEEDIVVLVLPYIHTAREGVLRLGKLLETYGTYESNGIAINDENEAWWLETIGGHHWIARRVPDDVCVINPNQFGMDAFDLEDAFGEQKAHLCSADLREFIADNHLDLNQDGVFNPRNIFGSRNDGDHVYNTPRAWYMGRYLAPYSYKWEGEGADFTPESDNIPWSLVPDRKVTLEDVKEMLSAHYQGTPYDPYSYVDSGRRGMYRSIGINRTGVTSICQIRSGVPEELKGLEWICYGPTTFSVMVPVYTHTEDIPAFLKNVTLKASTDNLYWSSRMIAALADPHFAATAQHIERYQETVMAKSRHLVMEYDRKMTESGDFSLTAEANEKICAMAEEETADTLTKVLQTASEQMKNGFNRADH